MVPFDSHAYSGSIVADHKFAGCNDNPDARARAAAHSKKAALIDARLKGIKVKARRTLDVEPAVLLLGACALGNLMKAWTVLEALPAVELPALFAARDEKGETFLHLAVLSGSFALVELLLARGCPADETNTAGFAPLFYAVRDNHADIISLLAAAGANVNRRTAGVEETPLMAAAYWGAERTLLALLKAGAETNAKDANGVTAVMRAAGQNHAAILHLLWAAGADFTAASASGRTAKDFAARAKAEASLAALQELESANMPGFLRP
jgi:hypothetical protein